MAKIVTSNEFPRFALSQCWSARDDDSYCGCEACCDLVGWGATESEAVIDYWLQVSEVLNG